MARTVNPELDPSALGVAGGQAIIAKPTPGLFG